MNLVAVSEAMAVILLLELMVVNSDATLQSDVT